MKLRLLAWVVVGLPFSVVLEREAAALPRTWIGGNLDWVDGGSTALWSPADEPDFDDEAIFNTANTVNLGSGNIVNGLTLSGGIDLFTNGFDLEVRGLVQTAGASTHLFIDGVSSVVDALDVIINGASDIQLSGGTLNVIDHGLLATGFLTVNAGGALAGHGIVNLDGPVVLSAVLNNNGTVTAFTRSTNIILPPAAGTLLIDGGNAFARIDLDGSLEGGSLNVNRNQTLDINVAPNDDFNGALSMFHNSTLDMAAAWTLGAGGTITVDNGAILGIPGTPAGTSTIAGAMLSQTGGTLTVVDPDGTLRLDAPFTMTGGTFTNLGLVVVNADVLINVANFDFDAGDWLIQNNAHFTVVVTDYDPGVVTNAFDGVITLDNADISVTTGDAEFVMDNVLNMVSNAPGQVTSWSGEPLDIGNDTGVLDAQVNVSGSEISTFSAAVDFNSDADVLVAGGSTLVFSSLVSFDTVNGPNQASISGSGTLLFNGQVNVNEAVTLDMAGGTVDLDGNDGTGEFINIDAPLMINAATLSSFGRINGGGGVNTLDINNSVGTGVLTVNLDDPAGAWTLNAPGVMNLVNDNTEATLLAGSDVTINGTVNVVGDVRTTARVDMGPTAIVNINTAVQPLRLAGGTLSSDPNTIAGGTINGVGLLGADTGRSLRGFGTINTAIDFDGASVLLADNGTLIIGGSILDVGTIGTFDVDGTLHVTNAWNNNVSTGVQLNGGVLSGGTITNDVVAGISGHGFVTARVINNTQLFASIGDSLIFQTTGNDNDWDGVTGMGQIHAVLANFELRDDATFGFTGTVEATNGHTVFANGFGLDFNPGSSLLLTNGTYESTSSTDIGGVVMVGAGPASTIEVMVNFFLEFESTSVVTLDGDLRLVSNNAGIEAGATFSGPGALIVPDGSHLIVDGGATVDVLLDMQGTFRPAGFDTVGRIDLRDYQQSDTGMLIVELIGTSLNQFDRLVVDGDVLLDGVLTVDIDGGFLPMAGHTFNIISGNSVNGTFSEVQTLGMPLDLNVKLNYLPSAVQVMIVERPPGDLDFDNDVDEADWAIFATCMAGPGVGVVPLGCSPDQFVACDVEEDGDVDLADYMLIQPCYSGSGVQADVDCLD